MTSESLEEIARRLAASAVKIDRLLLNERPEGRSTVVLLDNQILRLRAEERHLADWSVEAAIRNPRVQTVVGQAIENLNAVLPSAHRITTFEPV